MHYVYLLKSKIKKFHYIGYTEDLKKRFQEHNEGQTKSTKAYKPFELVYYEAYTHETTARKREVGLKHNSQQKEILFKRLFPAQGGPVV